MSKIEENKPKENLSYKKLKNLIDDEVNEKNEEDLLDNKDLNRTISQFNSLKKNNFIKEEDKIDQISLRNKDIHFSRISLNSKNNHKRNPKTEILVKNKNEMIKKCLIDNEVSKNIEEQNIVVRPKKVEVIKKEYKGTKCEKYTFYPISDHKIEPLIVDSNYNIFFILIIPQKIITLKFFNI